MKQTLWPDVVELPETIGKGAYVNPEDGSPCCAAGHFGSHFDGQPWSRVMFAHRDWRRAFARAAKVLSESDLNFGDDDVENWNDEVLTDEQRPVVYAAAWIMCGYDVADWPEAVELAEKSGINQ
jgi:hypothetical protein